MTIVISQLPKYIFIYIIFGGVGPFNDWGVGPYNVWGSASAFNDWGVGPYLSLIHI